jgi:carbonic anhydrase
MSVTDELLQNNSQYAESFEKGDLPPARGVVVCMDARLEVHKILGEVDAHVIRNAGGVITDDEIRSLAISQRLLGTREIILIHHTDCGMLTFSDDELSQSIARIQASPFVPHKDSVRGFVYEVETGRLREVRRAAVTRVVHPELSGARRSGGTSRRASASSRIRSA